MERNILRNHCLWQKSWTGPPQTIPFRSLTPRSSTISNSYSTISKPSKQGGRESNDSVLRRWKSVPSELGQSLSDEREPISMAEMLDNRRQERRYRRKPWTEKVTIKHNNPKYNREFLYGSFLPSDLTDVKRRTRKYVTNSKYGDIYELRYEVDKETKTEKQPFSRWLWEKEYKVWLSEKSPPRSRSEHSSRLEMTSPVRSKTPSSSRSQEPGGGASSLNRSITPSSNSRFAKKGAPDPQFYASYHSHRLQQRRRNDAARLIQAVFRGWSVRRFLQKLKRKVRLEHLMSWENFVNDYKNLIKRVQERYDVKRPYCGVDLKELLAFLDSKLKYEQTFRKLAYGDRVLKEDLPEFFTACDLHPTEGEIQQAFEKVFKGGNNSGEVIFVLDCSTSVTPMCFHYLTQFVKSVVESFTIGPDNIRVGVIPYSDDVYQAFGINRYNMTYQICSAVDNIAHNEGLTRTDLALKEMKKMFMCARPGVQKTGIVITDGKSSCPERTSQAARHVKEDNVNVITIGVGSQVDMEELRHIASSAKNVYSVYDYSSIHRLKDVIARRTCLDDSKQFSHKFGESCRPLERREVMEILWTTYPPSATKLNIRSSRWVRPMSKGTEAWTLLDEKVKKSTDINTCLQLVIKTKIEREGFITLPSDVREGVEQVSDPDIALDMVNKWIAQKQKEGSKFKGLN
ncbi:uncharacterized protein LOC134254612 [Saccostrea cucullata]|uniref:uncharacterized protein LOC134254612 n=1 Tax=Saccostrea cuccullata TaxID=36930 RepID=UPI002ED63928